MGRVYLNWRGGDGAIGEPVLAVGGNHTITRMEAKRVRLWRARRRHIHIDAELHRQKGRCTLVFLRNDRPLAAIDCADERAARSQARAKLRELELAGWIDHW